MIRYHEYPGPDEINIPSYGVELYQNSIYQAIFAKSISKEIFLVKDKNVSIPSRRIADHDIRKYITPVIERPENKAPNIILKFFIRFKLLLNKNEVA